jgi:tripartite-type tricarboxylate transporter receptor subunit TctC
MTADTRKVLAEPATKAKLEGFGLRVIGSTAEELAKSFKADMDKWGPLIKAAGLKAE